MQPVTEIWSQVSSHQTPPPLAVVLAAAVLAAVLVLTPSTWPVLRHAVTLVHEGGHALVATVSGRRLHGVRLHPDTSGLTVTRGPRRGAGAVLTFAAGYPAPGLLGLAAAAMLGAGYALGMLWALLVMLAVLLLHVRNWFGLASVLAVGVTLFAVTWWAPAQVQSAFAYLVAWFLLLAGIRPVLELQAVRRRGRGSGSDADQLARLTHVPAVLWVAVFVVITCGSAVLGAWWMVGAAGVNVWRGL